MQKSARLMGSFMPEGLLCDWQELDNKIEAFRLFQYADRELQAPPVAPALAPFRAIWVLEGAGHLAGLSSSLAGQGLLTDGDAASLPEPAMVPLHAGMGTAFAERLFGALVAKPSTHQIRNTVQRFLDACRANCRPGWEDACIEPVGLVVRCLYPNLLAPVSEAMDLLDPALRALFWHGVGRGLYFVPTNFLPLTGARERMLKSAAQESSDMNDRRNVLAGLIWAVTLVNLRQPAVIRSLIPACSDMQIRSEFNNGLISALLAWRHMAPEDERHIAVYTRPPSTNGREGFVWTDWIETPARDALQNIFPGLQQRNRIPALYTYRTSEELHKLSAARSRTRHA
jgi:hypothetical protein